MGVWGVWLAKYRSPLQILHFFWNGLIERKNQWKYFGTKHFRPEAYPAQFFQPKLTQSLHIFRAFVKNNEIVVPCTNYDRSIAEVLSFPRIFFGSDRTFCIYDTPQYVQQQRQLFEILLLPHNRATIATTWSMQHRATKGKHTQVTQQLNKGKPSATKSDPPKN